MENFIRASETKDKTEMIDDNRIDRFISVTNKLLEKGHRSFNTGLIANLPYLTDNEFEVIVKKALQAGWRIKQVEDNYNTVSYKFEKINEVTK